MSDEPISDQPDGKRFRLSPQAIAVAVVFGVLAGLSLWLEWPYKLWALAIGAIGGIAVPIVSTKWPQS
jgi:hypothetical protein